MRDYIKCCLSKLLFTFLFLAGVTSGYTQVSPSSDWTWADGESQPNKPGVYGAKGIAAAGNKPGARNAAGKWTDAAGNFWLFGGHGIDGTGASGYLNDLWKYNPLTGLWTWVGGENTVTETNGTFGSIGVPGPGNWPGSRDSRTLSWKDETGNFWLFGGYKVMGGANQALSDLWKYDPGTSMWTWVSGSQTANTAAVFGTLGVPAAANTPGGKHSSVGWSDGNGNLWLYGGVGPGDASYQNDLWKFNLSSKQWSWEGGDQDLRTVPVYNLIAGINIPPGNPGGRFGATAWTGSNGDLWMYGGNVVFTPMGSGQVGSDLWKYDISAKTWTWMSGSKVADAPTTYGLLGIEALGSHPGNRKNANSWVVGNTLYLYGGLDSDDGRYSDLWRYNIIGGFWSWISGDKGFDQASVHVTKGISSPSTKPGNRSKVTTWVDNNGNLWMFGGSATVGGTDVQFNDMMTYGALDCTPPVGTITPAAVDTCFGSSVLLHATKDYTYQWYKDGSPIAGATDSLYSATASGVYTVMLNPGVVCAALAANSATVTINPEVAFTAATTQPNCTIPTGSITVTASGGSGTGFTYSIDNGVNWQSPNVFTGLVPGSYQVIVRDDNLCLSTMQAIIVAPVPPPVTSTITSQTNISCVGGNTGEVIVTGGGGTGPYTYQLDGAGAFVSSGTFTNLAVGPHTVIVKDANGCTNTADVTITQIANTVGGTTTHTDVTCAGPNTGSITVTGSGGTAPYQYSIGAGAYQTGASFPGLAAGTYDVHVRDVNLCIKDLSVAIAAAVNTVDGTTTHTDVTCTGPNTGSITVTGSGGTAPYQYSIGAGTYQTGTSFPGLAAGTYDVHVRDVNLCIKDLSVTIAAAVNTVSSNITSQTNVSCVGGNTGEVIVTGGGGTGPYTYQLDGAGAFVSSGTFTNLAVGPHTVIVRDANGCTNTANITITQLANTVGGTTTHTDVTCAGPNTGSITVTGSGGTAPYQYSIGAGAYQTGASFPGLAAGTYDVHVRDANLCIKDLSVTIAAAVNTVTSNITSQTNVSCAGGNTGAVTVAGGGGTGPYTYQLDGAGAFVSSGTFTNLAVGPHTVIVRDANGCTNTANVTITQIANTVGGTTIHTDVTCAGPNTGSITVTGSGGTAPYQYSIGAGAYQTGASFPGLAAGTYDVHVRDANLCIKDLSVTIAAAVNTVSVSLVSKTDVACAGNTGTITVAGAGGTGPFTYQLGIGAFQNSASFSNLAAGNYTITAKDAAGCTNTVNVTIAQLNNTVSAIFSAHTNLTCAPGSTGSFTVSGTGGTAPYNYRFGTGIYQPNGTFSGLAAGIYTVSVRDVNSCTKDTSITITQSPNTVTAAVLSKTDIPCVGGTGSVTVAGSGGTAPYEYRIGTGLFQPGGEFTGLPAGSYTISVRDAVGCITNIPPVIIAQLATTLTAIVGSKTDIPCTGGTGSVTITAGGGTAPYNYKIGTGAYQASATFTDLPAGNYLITVQDALGCTRDLNVSIVALPNTVIPTLIARTDVPCSGGNLGSLSVSGSGGTAPYQYKLDNGLYQPTGVFTGLASGSYTVTVRDVNGCTRDIAVTIAQVANTVTAAIASKVDVPCAGGPGSVTITGGGGNPPYTYKLGAGAFQNSPTFNNLVAGDYIATVRDANGCTRDVTVTIIQTNNTVTATVTSNTEIPCTGGTGSVTVAGGGGTAPYLFSIGGAPYQASGVFSSLATGSYTISVKDANGCTKDIAVIIAQATNTVTATLVSKTDVPCSGGNIGALTVAGGGGTAPYTYKTGNGAFQASGIFNNLVVGAHVITVRDASGCTKDLTVNIAQLNNTVDATVVARRDVPCSGGSTGFVTVAGSGGTPPYEYKLGTAQYRASGVFIGLSAGSYTITVRDAAGCTKDLIVTIAQLNNTVTATLASKTDISCLGGSTGSITITGGGGTGPYEYKIGTGQYGANPTFSNLPAGNYIVSVQDIEGCSRDLPVTIVQLANSIVATINSKTDIPCAGGNVGSVTVTGSGGSAPYAYKLGSGQFGAVSTFNNLPAGEHIITVRDATGCSRDTTVTIVQLANTVTATLSSKVDIPCSGGTGAITVAATGGTAPYEYKLGSGLYQASGVFTGLGAGSYTVTVRDAGGCTKDITSVITQIPNTVTAVLGSKTDIGCATGNIGSITVTAGGGTAPYEYKLGSGQFVSSPTFNNLPAGNHIITVRDAVGCTKDLAVTLTQINNTVTATIVSKTNIPCTGGNTGSVTVAGGGGSAPFTYKLGTGTYQASGTFDGLGAGTYVITVKNALGCTKDTSVEITQANNTIVASVGSKTDVPCSGGNVGSVTITASGGTAPLTYKIGTGQYQSSATFNNLAGGDYIVTVKDAAGCTSDVPVTIAQADNTVKASVTTKTDVACSGGNVGSVTIAAAGGTAPFTYKLGTGQYQSSGTFNELAAGEYIATAKDAIGCTNDVKVIIGQLNNTLTATIGTKTDVPCSGGSGSVTITAGGGTAPYTYKLGNGQYSSSATFNNLPGGNYTVTVKDVAGCTKDVTVNIASPAGTPGSITPAIVDPICAGTSQVLTASDGVSYQWFRNDTLITGATGKTYSATESAKYSVTINNGACSIKASNTVSLTVNSCVETVIFVPKAFTPNNNNTNDKLSPKFINVKQFRYFKVYNRWGQMVYQTTLLGEGWEGTFKGVRQPMETYSWILECVDNNGKTIRTSGKTVLIR